MIGFISLKNLPKVSSHVQAQDYHVIYHYAMHEVVSKRLPQTGLSPVPIAQYRQKQTLHTRSLPIMAPVDHSGAYTAVVSGASGFIGTELVKQLLEKGYNVKGTVRDTSNKEKVAHLTKLAEVG